jgi:GPH family glycoside/pentoside/hexuronide:cation symporter
LSRRELALFAAPCLGLAGIGLPMAVSLPHYYSAQLGLSLGAVGMAFMAVRLIDIGLDPLLGVLMDRTRTRFGRFRPWLAAGTPLLMLASAMLFFAEPGVTAAYLIAGLALAYGGWSMCVLAQSSWGSLLSPLYNERSRIYGWWQVFNLIGLLTILMIPVAAHALDHDPAAGIKAMGVYLVVLLPLSASLAVLFVREPPPNPAAPLARMSDWPRLMQSASVRRILLADLLIGLALGIGASLLLFYFTRAKGFSPAFGNVAMLLYFIGALVGGPVWAGLSRRASKHAALAVSCLFALVGLAALYAIPSGQPLWGCAGAFVSGLPYAASNQIVRSLMADAGDEERLKSGVDRTGLLYAVLTGTSKIGSALAVGVTFLVLEKAGFDAASDHNSAGALLGLRWMFLGAPAVLFVLAALVLFRYPLNRQRHDEIREALERNP